MCEIRLDRQDRQDLPASGIPAPAACARKLDESKRNLFLRDPAAVAAMAEQYDGEILVPFAVESLLSGVEKPLLPNERLWYQKCFTLPERMAGKTILLHFGAVDWKCRVYINKTLVGEHTGGYCAFTFDITAFLQPGENELVVSVYDPTDNGWQQRGKQVIKTHGFWYTATSGIWQTVWLEAVSDCYVRGIKLLPDIDQGAVSVKTALNHAEGTALKLSVAFDGTTVFEGEVECEAIVPIPEPRLWSPEEPNLYDIKLEVYRDGKCTDTVTSYFGMRKFHVDRDASGKPRLFLNNKPYFQKGLLDQGIG